MKRSSSHTMWMQHFLEVGSVPRAAVPPPPLDDALTVGRPMDPTLGALRPLTPGVCDGGATSGAGADSPTKANAAALARMRGVLRVARLAGT